MIEGLPAKARRRIRSRELASADKADWLDGPLDRARNRARGDRRRRHEVEMETLKKVGLAISHVPERIFTFTGRSRGLCRPNVR
jgi:hypothetical protein